MYLVLDYDLNIVHINRAPSSKNLSNTEVYYNFDADSMQIATASRELVSQYSFTVGEALNSSLKVSDGTITKKTVSEQVEDGVITLKDTQMVDEESGVIRSKTKKELYETEVITEDEYSEYLLTKLRAKRDALLASCDYLMMSDYPISDEDKTEWETYRQSLRDLPANLSEIADLEKSAFPNQPE